MCWEISSSCEQAIRGKWAIASILKIFQWLFYYNCSCPLSFFFSQYSSRGVSIMHHFYIVTLQNIKKRISTFIAGSWALCSCSTYCNSILSALLTTIKLLSKWNEVILVEGAAQLPNLIILVLPYNVAFWQFSIHEDLPLFFILKIYENIYT